MNRRSVGMQMEQLAKEHLENSGCTVIGQNFRCACGEIDLIARDGAELVFAEVKYRRSHAYGLPEQAVTAEKQRKIRRVAEWYLQVRHFSQETSVRFDVIAIDSEQIRWYRNAF